MIAKEYTCDLCRSRTKDADCGWHRLKFANDRSFVFVPLTSALSASEQIICADCVETLKRLLA